MMHGVCDVEGEGGWRGGGRGVGEVSRGVKLEGQCWEMDDRVGGTRRAWSWRCGSGMGCADTDADYRGRGDEAGRGGMMGPAGRDGP